MQSLTIIFTSIAAAIVYGIVHDQVTARICVEYFTIGHPPAIRSHSPTAQAFYWGIVATWWVGLILGLGLAVSARAGKRPQLEWKQLFRPILVLVLAMYGIALLGGIFGFFTATAGIFHLVDHLAARVPENKHVAFLTVGWAHSASYLAGLLGGIVLWVTTWEKRKRLALSGRDLTSDHY